MRFTNKDLRQLIIPLIIEQVLAFAVGFTDSFMVSSGGDAATSAVSLVDTVMVLIIGLFGALATGGAVIAGHYIGQKKPKEACRATDQLILFIAVFSIALTGAIYLFHQWILTSVFGDITITVMENAKIYLLITAASVPFIALYNGGAAIFRAMGNSKIPMYIALLMNLINVTGNALLIYKFKMGVAGAAIPTLISRMFVAVLILLLLRNERHLLHLSRRITFRFDKKMIKRILHIGIPNGLENSIFQLGKILVLSLVASFGTAAVAANAVANAISIFQIIPGSANCLAMVTVVSQCVGAKEYQQAKYYTKKILLITYGAMLIINVVLYFILPIVLKVYGISPEAREMARSLIITYGSFAIIIWPLSFVMPNTLRAAGDVRYPMVVAIASMWTFRIGFSYIFGKYLGLGVLGVCLAMIVDWLFRTICFTWRYRSGKWQHQRV